MTPYVILVAACIALWGVAAVAVVMIWRAGVAWESEHNEKRS